MKKIAEEELEDIKVRFYPWEARSYTAMPNHVHAVLFVDSETVPLNRVAGGINRLYARGSGNNAAGGNLRGSRIIITRMLHDDVPIRRPFFS